MARKQSELKCANELAEYYINRYNIKEFGFKNNFSKKIERIMKGTKYDDTCSVWEYIKTPKSSKKGSHRITIAEFERYCFPELRKYIQKQKTDTNNVDLDRLEEDYLSYRKSRSDSEKWQEIAEKMMDQNNRSYTDEVVLPENSYDLPPSISDEIKNIGHGMMLEAIYNLFFEPFHWDMLKNDIDILDTMETGYNADISWETARAIHHYNHYLDAYVGERKNPREIYQTGKESSGEDETASTENN